MSPSAADGLSRRRLRLAALLVFAFTWATAAYFLWTSSVTPDLRLPEVDERDYFSEGQLSRTSGYETFTRANFLLSQVALVLALVFFARRGGRWTRESAAGRIGTGMLLGMVGLAIVWIVQLPFGIAQLWWDRRHGVSDDDYVSWVIANWFALGGEFLFICLALLIVMALAALLRHRWWILGGPAFVGLALLFAFVLPYMIPGLRPLSDRALAADARELAAAQGVGEIPVKVQEIRQYTSQPNAEAAGLGSSRRVILWDTLLDGRFGDSEVRVVLAHEFAHHSRNHIWKSVAWYALFALPGAYLIALATRRRGGMYSPRAVPLSLLVLVVLQLAALPIQNVITRHLETEADWVALEATRDPAAARALFKHFATTSYSDPSPPTWSYLLIDSHPALIERIAMAEAWEERAKED